MEAKELRYLKSLAKQYPNSASVATEMINLNAILNLPKGTEHFVTDIHGEYEQFTHILRNGSGAIRRKIDDTFGDSLAEAKKRQLATLIYYPEQKLELIKQEEAEPDMDVWYEETLKNLVRVAKKASSKYTRSKLRKSLAKDFAYVMEELMSNRSEISDLEAYYREIFNTVISVGKAEKLIIAFCNLIRRLTVDHLHVIGDIFDRGPYPHLVMDDLMNHHSIDIQWGNHDVLWMGAACGQMACIATVLRICARYGNLDILEDGYGINVVPLVRYALDNYSDDPCSCFDIHYRDDEYDTRDEALDMRIHKAISVLQFKLEGQLIKRHPEFRMNNRMLLHQMDLERGVVEVDGVEYELLDTNFPTINPEDPYALTAEEEQLMNRMQKAFLGSERLQRHTRFLYDKGSLYRVYNDHLMFHGCVPLNEDGSFREVNIGGMTYSGKRLYERLTFYARKAYFERTEDKENLAADMLWFCWTSPDSPVFGKEKMATFERYFIADKQAHKEEKNPYYKLYEKPEIIEAILHDFDLVGPDVRVINGHMPVKAPKGESPVKCGGKLLIIDGGFSKAYQSTTGIAGYTLTYNSYGIVLVAHEPFTSIADALRDEKDVHSHKILEEHVTHRKLVKNTDTGLELIESLKELEKLLEAYRKGLLPEIY